MAELTFAPGVREQLAAIARVRWQLFVNSLRTLRGRLELVSHIFITLGFAAGGIGGLVGVQRWRLLRDFERQSGMARCDPLADISFLAVVPGRCHRVHRKFRHFESPPLSPQLLVLRRDSNCLWFARAGHDAQLALALGSRGRSRNGLAEPFAMGRPRFASVCGGKYSARPHDLLLGGTLARPAPHPRNPRRAFSPLHHQFSADWSVDEPLRPQCASEPAPIRGASLSDSAPLASRNGSFRHRERCPGRLCDRRWHARHSRHLWRRDFLVPASPAARSVSRRKPQRSARTRGIVRRTRNRSRGLEAFRESPARWRQSSKRKFDICLAVGQCFSR